MVNKVQPPTPVTRGGLVFNVAVTSGDIKILVFNAIKYIALWAALDLAENGDNEYTFT
jgi:hypothetical protein